MTEDPNAWNVLTRRGVHVLDGFTLTSLIGGGLVLRCSRTHPEPETEAHWDWSKHVTAPTLLHLILVAQQHLSKDHGDGEETT